ncbi:hypothetical protein BDV93DRAFT_522999 [Ceratobasidium sp. AG-I]|nr:hypothetical protein BDV93DRAFT_522999 [Ceratobasidium sp. AG-I]
MSSRKECSQPVQTSCEEDLFQARSNRQLQELIDKQNRMIRVLEDIGNQNRDSVMRQSVGGVVVMGSFMAAVAVAFMAYANDLSGGGGKWYARAQIAFAFTFEYNLAVVIVGILVPLLRTLLRKEAGATGAMLAWLGWMLLLGLILMFIAFNLLLRAKFSSIIHVLSLVLIVFVMCVVLLYTLVV